MISQKSTKRVADEYITKEHGSTSRDQEDPKKMATPAQLAARKIKAPKSRVARSTTPTTSSSLSFGGGQSQPSFAFGSTNAAQSFPPLTQQQGFQFAVPGSSQSFTFGGGEQNGLSQAPLSNPFASNAFSSQPNNSMMEQSGSQQQQQQNTGGSFGFGNNSTPAAVPVSAPSTNGFSFGQSSSGGFGGSSVFGQPKPQEDSRASPSPTLFGEQPKTNGFSNTLGFGQPSQASQIPAASSSSAPPTTNLFGTVSSATPASTSTPNFSFGQTAAANSKSTTPQPEDATKPPKTGASFSFGQSTSFPPAVADTAKPMGLFNFAPTNTPSAVATPATTTAPSNNLFSFAPSSTPQPAPPATDKPFFNFGKPAGGSNEQQPASNLFGALSKPIEAAGASTSLFGRASPGPEPVQQSATRPIETVTNVDESKPVSNPFSSMFDKKPTDVASTNNKPTKPLFSFANTSASSSPTQQVNAASPSSFMSTTNPANFSPVESSQPMTGTMPAASQFQATGQTSTPSQPATSNLFNLNKPTPTASPAKEPSLTQKSSSTLFTTSDMNSNAGSTPFKSFGNTSAEDTGQTKKKLFQSPTAAGSMAQSAFSQPASTVPAPAEPIPPTFTQQQVPRPEKPSVHRAVSTEGPPQIPRYLDANKYKSYDENWRLKALNRRFQKVVSSTDPDTRDFVSIIQNYLDHRESIGEGLTRYMRTQATGSKRKANDVDEMQVETTSNKKSKPDAASTSSATLQKSTVNSSSMFSSVPSPKPPVPSSPAKPAISATSTLLRSMIPGAVDPATSASSAPTFSFGTASTKSTTPSQSPAKPVAFPSVQLPKFTPSSDFASAFAKNALSSAEKAEQEAKAKRKAEDFDSDEDDAEEWDKKDAEEQRIKKAKLEAIAKSSPGFVPNFTPSRSNSPFAWPASSTNVPAASSQAQSMSDSEKAMRSIESDGEGRTGSTSGESARAGNESGNSGDDEDEEEDDLREDQTAAEDEVEEEEGEPIPDLPKGQSLFDRIEKVPADEKKDETSIFGSATKPYYKPSVMFGNIGKASPAQPAVSPFTPKGDFVPASTFNFTSSSSGPAFGSALKEGPVPGEGLFGSRPSTPQPGPAKEATSIFGSTPKSSSASDNTWSRGTPIKFNGSTSADKDAPAIEVSAATPPAKEQSKAGFFGAATSNGGSLGFNFGGSTTPAPGYLAAASHLSTAAQSGFSSRGSSPGIVSEAESINTDASTAQDEEHSNQPQISLMESKAGEENETVLYEAKAHLSRFYKESEVPAKTKTVTGWNKMGTGVAKVLKDKESGKCRIVFRAEPNANVLLNTRLIKGAKYTSSDMGKSGAITLPVAAVEGGMQMWMIRVKTRAVSDEFAKIMEENKSN